MAATRISTIIDQAADDTVPLPTLLRNVKIVASRIGAHDLDSWATSELNGYQRNEQLPVYRGPFPVFVRGTWSGPMQSSVISQVAPDGLDPAVWGELFSASLREPVAELQSLATSEGDGEPASPWPPGAVVEYNRLVENGQGGATINFHALFAARQVIPRTQLLGVLDVIRTQVLNLALALERASDDAGENGGPTVTDPAVGQAVGTFIVNVYGDGAHISTGDHATHQSTVAVGDTVALLKAAIELGLPHDEALAFVTAVQADQSADGPQTRSFLQRLRSGAVQLATGVATDAAAGGLVALGTAFLGG